MKSTVYTSSFSFVWFVDKVRIKTTYRTVGNVIEKAVTSGSKHRRCLDASADVSICVGMHRNTSRFGIVRWQTKTCMIPFGTICSMCNLFGHRLATQKCQKRQQHEIPTAPTADRVMSRYSYSNMHSYTHTRTSHTGPSRDADTFRE